MVQGCTAPGLKVAKGMGRLQGLNVAVLAQRDALVRRPEPRRRAGDVTAAARSRGAGEEVAAHETGWRPERWVRTVRGMARPRGGKRRRSPPGALVQAGLGGRWVGVGKGVWIGVRIGSRSWELWR